MGRGDLVTPARPGIKDIEEKVEQQCQPEEDQRDSRGDRVNGRSKEEPPTDLLCLFRREVSAEQPTPVSRVPPHGVEEDTDYGEDSTVERGGDQLAHPRVKCFGEYSSGERLECDQHQVEDVKQQQHSIHADDVLEHGVVVAPGCADDQEAHDVCEVRRPDLEEFCSKRCTGWRHFDFEHQQGDGEALSEPLH